MQTNACLMLGNVQCSSCDGVTILKSLEDVPQDKRTLGKMFMTSSTPIEAKTELSQIEEFHNSLGKVCIKHGLENTFVEVSTLESGCENCFRELDKEAKILSIGKMNEKISRGSRLASHQDQVSASLTQARRSLKQLESELNDKKIQKLQEEVRLNFSLLHNCLEWEEHRISKKLQEKQVSLVEQVDQIERTIDILESIQIRLHESNQVQNRGFSKDSKPNLCELLKLYDRESKNIQKICDSANKVSINPEIVVNPKFGDILRSLVYIEASNEIPTPPDSAEEEDSVVQSSLIAELQNYAMENSVDLDSQNIVDFESKVTKLRQILIDVKSRADRCPTATGTVKIVDISKESDEGSSCDVTIEDEAENSSDLSNDIVPRNKRIEVEILRIENPSEIYMRKAVSDYDHTRLREDLGIFYNRKAASANANKNKRSDVTAGMWTEGRLCVVRTEDHGWARARVVHCSDEKLKLYLVDAGLYHHLHIKEDVPKVQIFSLDKQFLFPAEAFTVKVDNICPIGNGNKWSQKACEQLQATVDEANVVEIEVID